MKKASLSLSIEAIVILILAIVVMAFALPFIKDLFEKTKTGVVEQFPVIQIQADSFNPIGIGNEFSLKPGQERKLTLNIYNKLATALTSTDVTVTCVEGSQITAPVKSSSLNIPSGQLGQLKVVLKGGSTMKNNDICTISVGGISQQFFLVTT